VSSVDFFTVVTLSAASNCLLALAFGVLFRHDGFFNFVVAAAFAVSAYGYVVADQLQVGTVPGLIFSFFFAYLLVLPTNLINEHFRKGTGSQTLALLIISFAWYSAADPILSVLFGSSSRTLAVTRSGIEGLPGGYFGLQGVATVYFLLALGLIACVHLLYTTTPLGLRLRATSSDRTLVASLGYSRFRVANSVGILASFLIAVSSFVYSSMSQVNPQMGVHALQTGLVVWLLVGSRSVYLIALAGLFTAFVQHAVNWFGPAGWGTFIYMFIILLAFLLKRKTVA